MRTVAIILFSATLLTAGGCRQISRAAGEHHYQQARLLIEAGDADAALAELKRAVRADPKLSVAHAAAGDIHRRRGDYEQARDNYVAACRTNPYAFRAHYNLGYVYQKLADAAGEGATFRRRLRDAVIVYLRAVTLEPSDFDTNLNLSACYFRLGKYRMAEEYCRAAIALRDGSAEAWSNLGVICDSQNKLYEAIGAYKASLEREMDQPKLWLNLGSTYMRQGRLDAATHAFNQAAERDPESPAPWEQMGACYYYRDRMDAAEDAYLRALELDDRSAAAHRGLGIVYMTRYVADSQADELRDKALAAWNASLEIDPGQSDLRRLVRKYTPKPAPPHI